SLLSAEPTNLHLKSRVSCAVVSGRVHLSAIGNPALLCSLRISLKRFFVPLLLMPGTVMEEFEEGFNTSFQLTGNKRSRPDPTTDQSLQLTPKGLGKAKGNGRGRGSYRSGGFQPLQTQATSAEQDHQSYGNNLLGYGTQDWTAAPQQPPWRMEAPSSQLQEMQYRMDHMSRLMMRHEMELLALRVDTGFMMHLRVGSRGIVKQLFQASKEYSEKKARESRMQLTLKQTLLLTVFRVLKDRLAQLETKTDLVAHMRKMGWFHATENQWMYLRWSPEKETLVPEDPPRMSPHASLQAHLESIMELLEEDHVLHQFNTIKKLSEDLDQTLPFFLKVSLQGAKAQNLFQRLLHLCGHGCLQWWT
ncbi:unnamed protein product, partial [Symbiodinium microadriaticum]